MAKYLVQGSYTVEGVKGLMVDAPSARRQAVETMLKSLGGRLEAMYFALGDTDFVIIADLPDNASAAAIGMVVAASGGARTRTTVLLTAEEMDGAAKKQVSYRAPGR